MRRLIALLTIALVSIFSSCVNKPSPSKNNPNAVIIEDSYGSKNIKNNTGSVSVQNNLNDAIPLEIYLKRVPGVMVKGFGSDAVVTIRGQFHSLMGSSEPLFVVNGIPVNGGFSAVYGICPSDEIASITVLKDAASTAIYGSSSGNGVILIKLKDQ